MEMFPNITSRVGSEPGDKRTPDRWERLTRLLRQAAAPIGYGDCVRPLVRESVHLVFSAKSFVERFGHPLSRVTTPSRSSASAAIQPLINAIGIPGPGCAE